VDKIAALLTCHNRREKTLQCLKALMEQQGKGSDFQIDVHLVDDASTDDTAAAVSAAFPEVRIIPGNGNLYWNRGMHLAWAAAALHADYDYYLWLNDDTYIIDSCVLELVKSAKEKGNASVICASLRSNITQEWTYGGYRVVSNKNVPVVPTGLLEACETINGNCVLVPRPVYTVVGNIDPAFIHAIGDLDYGLRARQKGFSLFVAPHYLGYCEKDRTWPKWCLPQYSLKERARNLYSPLGNSHPYYFFIYEYRHFGVFTATKHFFSIHLRLFIPRLWK